MTFQTSKLPKILAKKTKNMTSLPCSVRPEKFHPYRDYDEQHNVFHTDLSQRPILRSIHSPSPIVTRIVRIVRTSHCQVIVVGQICITVLFQWGFSPQLGPYQCLQACHHHQCCVCVNSRFLGSWTGFWGVTGTDWLRCSLFLACHQLPITYCQQQQARQLMCRPGQGPRRSGADRVEIGSCPLEQQADTTAQVAFTCQQHNSARLAPLATGRRSLILSCPALAYITSVY